MYTGKEKQFLPLIGALLSGAKIDGAKTYWTFGGSGTAGNASWNPGVPTIDPVTVAGREENQNPLFKISINGLQMDDGVDFDDELKGKSGLDLIMPISEKSSVI